MLIDSGLRREFWAEALTYAAKIVNCVPCKGTGKIPDEMWYNRKIDFDVFKRFGCTAFVHVPAQKRKKLDDKGIECIFVGFSDNAKAFRLYCDSTKKLITSPDVQFIENESVSADYDEQFFIELSESGGEMTVIDSLNSNQNLSVQEEIIDANADNQLDTTLGNGNDNDAENADADNHHDTTPEVLNGSGGENLDETVVNQNDSVYSDASMFDDTVNDPTFTTRAAIDPNAQPPVTRSASMFNLLNVGFAFCTGLPTTPDEACYGDEKDKWIEAMRSEI